ncbi:MAG: hypothetical protein HRT57_13095, partial [Crocinitomicaceae bacterium]|nr:hypothetical protein [Crocinitomicaceae bacterium]
QTPELTKLRDLFNDGKHEKVKEQLFEVSNNPTNRKHYLYWVLKGSIDLQSIAAKSSKEFDPNDLESVYEDFEKAIKISNYIELTTYELSKSADAYFKKEEFDNVITIYESAISLLRYSYYPDTLFHYNIAVVCDIAGDKVKAKNKNEYCVENDCDRADSYLALINWLKEEGKNEEAGNMVNEAQKKYPGNSSLLLYSINNAIESGDSKAALKYCLLALKGDP